MPEHDCRQWLEHREKTWVETHGLDCGPYETCYEEWWECICGEKYTEKEMDLLWKPEEKQAVKRPNDCCKAYIFEAEGGTLTVAETSDRLSIEVSVNEGDAIHLNRAQFKTLCDLDSSYDGLEVEDAPEPEPEPEEERDVIPA